MRDFIPKADEKEEVLDGWSVKWTFPHLEASREVPVFEAPIIGPNVSASHAMASIVAILDAAAAIERVE